MNQIDVLPDDVLLEIFDFFVDKRRSLEELPWEVSKAAIKVWQLLVHVCRRWRNLVLGSPRRLNLRLYCSSKTRIRDMLDIWPALPLVVDNSRSPSDAGTGSIIAALGLTNRIRQVYLNLENRKLEEVLVAMQVPFPVLIDLEVSSSDSVPPVLPDSFLGGSAPSLKFLMLGYTRFPGLPKFLLSATQLAFLHLSHIPHPYISPEAMVAMISVLSGLKVLLLHFQVVESRRHLPASGRESQSLSLPNRPVLPVLNRFFFHGFNEYLEDLVNRIDAPQLDEVDICFFCQYNNLDVSRLAQFINRSPTLRARDIAHVQINYFTASVALLSQSGTIKIGIPNDIPREPDLRLAFVAQICNALLHPLSAVEDLYVIHENWPLVWKNDAIEGALWFQLLLPFIAVKNLYFNKEFAPGIAAALQELVGGRITEVTVLPSLENIFVDQLGPSGSFQENIGQFIAARQLSDHPIVISFWRKDDSST